jgi:hypothetical protein
MHQLLRNVNLNPNLIFGKIFLKYTKAYTMASREPVSNIILQFIG